MYIQLQGRNTLFYIIADGIFVRNSRVNVGGDMGTAGVSGGNFTYHLYLVTSSLEALK
jgi:hypothetical protein